MRRGGLTSSRADFRDARFFCIELDAALQIAVHSIAFYRSPRSHRSTRHTTIHFAVRRCSTSLSTASAALHVAASEACMYKQEHTMQMVCFHGCVLRPSWLRFWNIICHVCFLLPPHMFPVGPYVPLDVPAGSHRACIMRPRPTFLNVAFQRLVSTLHRIINVMQCSARGVHDAALSHYSTCNFWRVIAMCIIFDLKVDPPPSKVHMLCKRWEGVCFQTGCS
jgi:hypothetical protein